MRLVLTAAQHKLFAFLAGEGRESNSDHRLIDHGAKVLDPKGLFDIGERNGESYLNCSIITSGNNSIFSLFIIG